MGICEILTIIFVVCKVFGVGAIASWSWFLVLLPEIIKIGWCIIVFVIGLIACLKA